MFLYHKTLSQPSWEKPCLCTISNTPTHPLEWHLLKDIQLTSNISFLLFCTLSLIWSPKAFPFLHSSNTEQGAHLKRFQGNNKKPKKIPCTSLVLRKWILNQILEGIFLPTTVSWPLPSISCLPCKYPFQPHVVLASFQDRKLFVFKPWSAFSIFP